MLFEEVVGQQLLKKNLIQTVKQKRISHAQMFFGKSGYGGLQLALAFAQYVNCKDPQEDDSCGKCASCLKYQKLIHPDLHLVFPVIKTDKIKKPVSDDYIEQWRNLFLEKKYITYNDWFLHIKQEKKQGLIYESESTSIIKKLNMKPYEAAYKTMIIWFAEKMNPTCANKILKIIEEPPPKTLILMVVEQTDSILPTILSRAQLWKVPMIANEEMNKALILLKDAGEEKIKNLVKISAGDYNIALNYLGQKDDMNSELEEMKQMMRHAWTIKTQKSNSDNKPMEDITKWAEERGMQNREKQKTFLESALRLIRKNFVFNMNNREISYMSDEEEDWAEKFAPFINSENIRQIAEELNLAHAHIERNANGKLVFFDLVVKLSRLIKK